MRRVLFVGRTRYANPLSATHARKFEAVGGVLDYRVVGSAATAGPPPERFALARPLPLRALDGPAFYLRLPFLVARELRRFRPDAVIAQSPYEGLAALAGRALARSRARVLVEVHGDWRTAPRLYGSQLRALVAPVADRAAAVALRRADGVRTVSAFTTGLVRALGVEPAAVFHTYSDLDAFAAGDPKALPREPRFAFVGVLERYKNVEGLAAAWRLAAPRLPDATLELVGDGRLVATVEALLRDVPGRTVWHRRLEPGEVAALLDRSWALVLPSFSEGLPRVALEALARGRPVVGSRAGGIPDAVADGENGLLVPPGDAPALAEALVRLASDPELAERLASAARPSVEALLRQPEEYAERLAALVEGLCRRQGAAV
ncbi:MAG TPA: glycosyltransferase family 4 protein [Gaiellaceae bacterium]|nr:glycosyltransferase family 4 protein [Gaiellaceae bacterium]